MRFGWKVCLLRCDYCIKTDLFVFRNVYKWSLRFNLSSTQSVYSYSASKMKVRSKNLVVALDMI